VICPRCGAEYASGLALCPECLAPPTERTGGAEGQAGRDPGAPVAEPVAEPLGLVTVFRCGDPSLVALAESILRSADIPFVVENETTQDRIGIGWVPFERNVAADAVEILVTGGDAEDARQLLRDLEQGTPADAADT